MPRYLLDTNFLFALFKAQPKAIRALRSLRRTNCFISVCSALEVGAGEGARDPRRAQNVADILDVGDLVPMTEATALRAARTLTRFLHPEAEPLLIDAAIAATVMIGGFVLVTKNTGHYRALGVPASKLLNWEDTRLAER
jgi:predicted nucleic acid-binding protein